ncbi:uncharacterized protein LOC112091597 [Morus notabilis]|uniref:uncharacterized protein LOC112091597 n=1 Tax=Morus notabilis TaxID=981085 RepID=UPI000CED571F|nr:uncharacterized protein LOC112091597 [Morus notabilis]
MGLFSNKVDRRILKPGDHIYTYRTLHSYSHHGIYVEENRVIHFTRTTDLPGESSIRCNICDYHGSTQRGVVKTCIDCFLGGHELYRFEYNVSKAHFCTKNLGTCSVGSSDAPNVVVQRAIEMLAGRGFSDYDLLNNNCESFAVYCTTGKAVSSQGLGFKHRAEIAAKMFTSKPLTLGNIASTFNELAFAHKIDAIEATNASSSSEKYKDNK